MKERNFVLGAKVIFPVAALLCLVPGVPSFLALLSGMCLAVFLGNPYIERTRKVTHLFLAFSVVGLGAGMNLHTVGQAGFHGIGYTLIGITFALILGKAFGKVLGTPKDASLLVCVGTAICGGSAIAAVAPTIRAKPHEVSIALGTVFILNAAGLVFFPWMGHYFGLTQPQFGLWAALAIHDTSSVVGATLQYGSQALEIGTTVKLARALWIVPVTFAIGMIRSRSQTGETSQKIKKPWFILGFLTAAALATWIPGLQGPGHLVEAVARRTLVLTLFLIGSNLTLSTLKSVGIRPFAQGVLLWLSIATVTLGGILSGWISYH